MVCKNKLINQLETLTSWAQSKYIETNLPNLSENYRNVSDPHSQKRLLHWVSTNSKISLFTLPKFPHNPRLFNIRMGTFANVCEEMEQEVISLIFQAKMFYYKKALPLT